VILITVWGLVAAGCGWGALRKASQAPSGKAILHQAGSQPNEFPLEAKETVIAG
jgi:hypothetical protein